MMMESIHVCLFAGKSLVAVANFLFSLALIFFAYFSFSVQTRESWHHQQKQRHGELCSDYWLNFALVTVQNCAVHMGMDRDSVIVLSHNAKLQAASHCCLHKFSPEHSPIITKPQPHRSKWWTIKIFWAISNTFLNFWNLKNRLARSWDTRIAIYHVKRIIVKFEES